jgi:predicted RNA binding protein YcfA (HicA-like mRNA interferase family)
LPELPVCSGGEVIRALERLGFRVVRQRGSHVMLRKGMDGCVVPLHRELKRETLSGILRQAGVGASEFISTIEK